MKQRADLKGLKLRALTYWTGRLLAMLGVAPKDMPLPNATEALSLGPHPEGREAVAALRPISRYTARRQMLPVWRCLE